MFESFFPKHIFLIFKRAYNAYQTHVHDQHCSGKQTSQRSRIDDCWMLLVQASKDISQPAPISYSMA